MKPTAISNFLNHLLHHSPEAGLSSDKRVEAGLSELRSGDQFNALNILKPAATDGDVLAQTLVGAIYRELVSLPENYHEAVKWFSLAAAQNYPLAQSNLALMYLHGLGVEKNVKLALQWLTQAAQSGNVNAQYELGAFYEQGYLGEPGAKEAASWYRLASAQEYSPAHNALASLLLRGDGVPKDTNAALALLERSASQNNVDALLVMADFHFENGYLSQNLAPAVLALERAAKLGSPIAQSRLGHMYLFGRGVQQNEKKAEKLLNEAAANGDGEAALTLRELDAERTWHKSQPVDYSRTPDVPPTS